jgi:hypothetical protein
VDSSTTWPDLSIDEYAPRTAAQTSTWPAVNGQQAGNASKLAHALLVLAEQAKPPLRFVVGSDAVEAVSAAKPGNCSLRPKPPARWARTWHTTTSELAHGGRSLVHHTVQGRSGSLKPGGFRRHEQRQRRGPDRRWWRSIDHRRSGRVRLRSVPTGERTQGPPPLRGGPAQGN